MSIYLNGCQKDELPAETVPPSGTSDSYQQPEPASQETDIPQTPETYPIPPKTETIPDSSNQRNSEESTTNSGISIDPPGTPIHPFYGLDGTPPSAPGLAMQRRTFDAEPDKIAYLTFDDGPYPESTPRILKILQDEGVKATFFVLGSQVDKYPDLLRAEFEQGEGIGNHTYSHDYSSVYPSPSPTPEAFLAEIRQAEDVIFKTIGIRPKIIRAPGGTQNHFHINYYNALDAAGYLVYDWNVTCGDASAPVVPAEQLIENIKTQVPNKPRVIILMHDTKVKTTTIEALPQIIEFLKQQGYSFGVITEKVAPILFPGGFNS
ncbi:polysaccharide deacetylase family protein [Desulfosporosinus orientis]|nr:polysaccharide deacetylase family protein [Desulfosporosinus orientis]